MTVEGDLEGDSECDSKKLDDAGGRRPLDAVVTVNSERPRPRLRRPRP
jgi:hypothetical protein